MADVPVDAGLALPRLAPNHRLQAVLAGAQARLGEVPPPLADQPWFPANYFDLDAVDAFVALEADAQARVLARCSRQLLEEAWHIERIGLAFVAKMILLAPTAEERVLYGLFGADEARHLLLIDALLGHPASVAPTVFHELLAEVIEYGDRPTLVLVVQVVLEGWGLAHYRAMADHTSEPTLAHVLRSVLTDEAAHHGAGLAVFSSLPFEPASRMAIVGVLDRLLGMVRAGPVMVLDALLTECPAADPAVLFEQLDGERHAATRLASLRDLLLRAGALETVARLDAQGSFSVQQGDL